MKKVFTYAIVIFQNKSIINSLHSMILMSMKSSKIHKWKWKHITKLSIWLLVKPQHFILIMNCLLCIFVTPLFNCWPIWINYCLHFSTIQINVYKDINTQINENHDCSCWKYFGHNITLFLKISASYHFLKMTCYISFIIKYVEYSAWNIYSDRNAIYYLI